MADQNESQNGASHDFDIPTISAPGKDKKQKNGVFGLGGSGATNAAGVAVRSGPLGLVFRNLGLILKLAPAVGTLVMGVAMPAYNKALNKAMYDDAVAKAQLMHKATELPSDEAVAKMRANTGMDNESLLRSKNGGKGMSFGEAGDDPAQEAAASEAAKAGMDGSGGAAGGDAEKAAADSTKMADAMKQSAFGKSDFGGADAAGGGGGGGSSASSGGKLTSQLGSGFAPENKFGSMKGMKNGGKAAKMQQAKAVGQGRDGRKMGGTKGKGLAQLKMAALHSKRATTMKNYQAASASAGKAFDGGTMVGDTASGIGGAGAGEGGAGLGEGAADEAAADALAKGIQNPKVAGVPVAKNSSCEGANKDAMKSVMSAEEHSELTGKCDAQQQMNTAFLWLAAAALATIPLAIMSGCADALMGTVFGAAAGVSLKGVVVAACIVLIAAANVIAIMAAVEAMKYPSLKTQGAMLIAGTVMVDIAAASAMMSDGSSGAAAIKETGASLAQAMGNATQGMSKS